MTFYLKVGDDGRIEDISFEGEGCTISQAASSIVTEMFTGKTLADVENTPAEAILDMLGREIAATRLKCATLGLNTTKEAVRRCGASRSGMQASHGTDSAGRLRWSTFDTHDLLECQ